MNRWGMIHWICEKSEQCDVVGSQAVKSYTAAVHKAQSFGIYKSDDRTKTEIDILMQESIGQ